MNKAPKRPLVIAVNQRDKMNRAGRPLSVSPARQARKDRARRMAYLLLREIGIRQPDRAQCDEQEDHGESHCTDVTEQVLLRRQHITG